MSSKQMVSIGIPTYEAGRSLIATLASIYRQKGIVKVSEILLVVDGNTIDPLIRKAIEHPKLKIIFKTKRFGQSTRLNGIFKLASSDLLIITNDDVILKNDVVDQVLGTYRTSKADLIAVQVATLPNSGFIEKIIKVSNEITRYLTDMWDSGDNYLSCNGRLLGLSKRFYKSVTLPKKLWNNDAYLYVYAKIKGFSFKYLITTEVYYQLPHTLKDHFSQSVKFSFSQRENQEYFKGSISSFYAIPFFTQLLAVGKAFWKNPLYTSAYFFVVVFARIQKLGFGKFNHSQGYWNTDRSTKVLTRVYGK